MNIDKKRAWNGKNYDFFWKQTNLYPIDGFQYTRMLKYPNNLANSLTLHNYTNRKKLK